MNFIRLWKFSSQIHTELVLGSRIKATGDNKDVVLDRYKEDLSKLKSNSRFNSLFVSSILILPAFIAIQSINESFLLVANGNDLNQVLFANSIAIASYYIFNFVFMLIFGLMTIASLLDGKIFKFLHTLPFSKTEIQLLGIMSFVRLLLYQLVIMLFVFPIGMMIISGSLAIFLITFSLNLINLVLGCYMLIILIDKMTGLLFDQNQKFGLRSFFRYIFFVVYILVAFSIYYFVGSIDQFLEYLYFNEILPLSTISQINNYLPLIAFPFATGYLISLIILGSTPNQLVLVNAIVGLIFLVLLTLRIVIKGNKILLNMAYKSDEPVNKSVKRKGVKIIIEKPLRSYFRLNILIATRDLSALISLTMAVLFPILPLIQGNNQNLFATFLFYSGFIIFFAANALSVTEGSVGGLLSSLPISHRLMLRGKTILLALVYLLAYTILNIVSMFSISSPRELFLIFLLALMLPNLFLIGKSRLFGRINGEYTLFDIEDTNNFLRNIVLIIPIMIVVSLELAILNYNLMLNRYFGISGDHVFLIFNFLLFLCIETINRKMFRAN